MSATDVARIEQKIAERITPASTGQLVVGSTGLAIRDMNQLLEFAKIMAIGGVSVPKHLRGNPGACIAVTLQAIEWGMSPFAVANKSYSVNDRLAYEAQLIHAVLLRRAPIKGRPRFEYSGDGDSRQCTVTVKLAEDGNQEVDYTSPKFKDIAVKNSPLWKADLDQQLGYYAVRSLARRHFPDTLLGVIEREEARYGAIEGEVVPGDNGPEDNQPPATRTGRQGIDQRLAELGKKDEPAQTDIIDEETGEILERGVGEETAAVQDTEEDLPADMDEQGPVLPPALLSAARKGSRSLKLALGKLPIEDYEAIPNEVMVHLQNIAKMSNMKTGETPE